MIGNQKPHPREREVGDPSLWPRYGGVFQEHAIVVIRQVTNRGDWLREGCGTCVALHFLLDSPYGDLDLRAGAGHLHGIELPTVQATVSKFCKVERPALPLHTQGRDVCSGYEADFCDAEMPDFIGPALVA